MDNKPQTTKPMSEWDKQACVHLDDLWDKHNSGALKAGDVDVVFSAARVRIERTIKEQQAQRGDFPPVQPHNYAV